jgi:septin 7
VIHEAKLAKMEAAMKEVFREKVELQEQKLKQSEVELYARHKDLKDALNKQWSGLMEKKQQLETGSPPADAVSNLILFAILSAHQLVAEENVPWMKQLMRLGL